MVDVEQHRTLSWRGVTLMRSRSPLDVMGDAVPKLKPRDRLSLVNRNGRRWVSLDEGAEYVGVTSRTIRQWITEGKIRGYRVNSRLIRIDLNELDAALQPFGGDGA